MLFLPRKSRWWPVSALALAAAVATVFLLLAAVLAGCQSADGPPAFAPTLAGNPRLPGRYIRPLLSAEEWTKFAARPYDAFVILRARLADDGSVLPMRVLECHPDASRNAEAADLCRNIAIRPVRVGSHIKPLAEVYVVFYETDPRPHIVLVFGRQEGRVAATGFTGEVRQLFIRRY